LLGTEILPDDSNLQVHYEIWNGIYGYSILEDSVRTDGLPFNLLGSMYDSTYGTTTAGVATQFVLSSNGVTFGQNPQLDSMVLEVRYQGQLFGDSTSTLTLHVYELSQDIYFDSTYQSNYNFQTYDIDFADYNIVPRPHDSTIVGNDTLPPTLRINLSNIYPDLGEKILNADSNDLSNNENFIKFFKGLYIVAGEVTNSGSIFTIDFTAHGSKLALYFSNDEEDSLLYNFYVAATASPRINTYKHNYSIGSQDFVQQVVNGDTLLGGQKFYIQGLGGVKAIIKIPDLRQNDSIDFSKVAINEVKLFLPGIKKSDYPPEKLALVRVLEDGSYAPMTDEYEGVAYFGGDYEEGSNRYVFRISRFVQKLISDEDYPNYGLYLFVAGASYKPNTFTFKGNNYDDFSGMHLDIIYTFVN
jgi:hypothetical protein